MVDASRKRARIIRSPIATDPTMSVVITNFNYARYLPTAIDSALAQAYPAHEVIVVDDGSTDGSQHAIEAYGDRIIPILKPNGGQTSAFNAALQRADGEIVCFLDADDALEPTALDEVRLAFRDPEAVKVHWPLWVIGPDGHRTGQRKPTYTLHEGDVLPQMLRLGPDDPSWVPTSGNAWRRSFLESVFPLPQPERKAGVGSASADAYLSMLAPLFGTVRRIDNPQGSYRVHGSNDHSCMDFEKRLHRDVLLFEERAAALARYCREMGISVDQSLWRESAWCHKLKRALESVDALIVPSQSFVLVDDSHWQLPQSERRRPIPFLEKDGQYVGPPRDSNQAITELERLRNQGAAFIAVAWSSFWWFTVYPQFEQHLRSTFPCLCRTSDIIVYRL
jgi:glycosyltransferase involved in cell wall biosynthesis